MIVLPQGRELAFRAYAHYCISTLVPSSPSQLLLSHAPVFQVKFARKSHVARLR